MYTHKLAEVTIRKAMVQMLNFFKTALIKMSKKMSVLCLKTYISINRV